MTFLGAGGKHNVAHKTKHENFNSEYNYIS